MSENAGADDDTARSYRLDRLAGFCVIGALVLSLSLLVVGEPLFWVPFAVGFGIGLPGFAILADRERDRPGGGGPATASTSVDDSGAGDDNDDSATVGDDTDESAAVDDSA